MELIAQILVLLLLARALGEVSVRLGQPSAVGEIIAGIIVAAVAVAMGDKYPFLGELADSETLDLVTNAAIFFLVLMAGIEMRPSEVTEHSGTSFAVATGRRAFASPWRHSAGWYFLPESDAKQALAFLIGIAWRFRRSRQRSKYLTNLTCCTRGSAKP